MKADKKKASQVMVTHYYLLQYFETNHVVTWLKPFSIIRFQILGCPVKPFIKVTDI